MQQWLEFFRFDVTDPLTAYETMTGSPMMIEMMGMATQAELDQLKTLAGSAFDQLFLQLMIDHHQGKVDMCVDVMTNGQAPVLQSMANDMLTTPVHPDSPDGGDARRSRLGTTSGHR